MTLVFSQESKKSKSLNCCMLYLKVWNLFISWLCYRGMLWGNTASKNESVQLDVISYNNIGSITEQLYFQSCKLVSNSKHRKPKVSHLIHFHKTNDSFCMCIETHCEPYYVTLWTNWLIHLYNLTVNSLGIFCIPS